MPEYKLLKNYVDQESVVKRSLNHFLNPIIKTSY
jgi:hypothetical protein